MIHLHGIVFYLQVFLSFLHPRAVIACKSAFSFPSIQSCITQFLPFLLPVLLDYTTLGNPHNLDSQRSQGKKIWSNNVVDTFYMWISPSVGMGCTFSGAKRLLLVWDIRFSLGDVWWTITVLEINPYLTLLKFALCPFSYFFGTIPPLFISFSSLNCYYFSSFFSSETKNSLRTAECSAPLHIHAFFYCSRNQVSSMKMEPPYLLYSFSSPFLCFWFTTFLFLHYYHNVSLSINVFKFFLVHSLFLFHSGFALC